MDITYLLASITMFFLAGVFYGYQHLARHFKNSELEFVIYGLNYKWMILIDILLLGIAFLFLAMFFKNI